MSRNLLLNIAGCLLFLCLFQATAIGQIYVDQSNTSGTEDGTSWSTAYTDLQDALGAASSGAEIWVAQGTYKPTSGSDQHASFELKEGVSIIGGFQTGGTAGSNNAALNQTILSGDLGGTGIADNSYSVVFSEGVSAATILDGFYVIGGYSTGNCFDGSASARQKFGGGWFNRDASPTVKNCVFEGNRSDCGGGAIYNDGGAGKVASPTYTNCKFNGNYSDQDGGAMYNNGNGGAASPTFLNCSFIGNSSSIPNGSHGGTIFNFGKSGNSNTSYVNCLFASNSGFAGAGIYNLASSGNANNTITNCTFYANYAEQGAGAVYVNADGGGNSIADISNTIFWLNQANQFSEEIFKMVDGEINIQRCIADADNCAAMSTGDGVLNCIGGMLFNDVYNDPLFANPAAEDYSLSLGSAAINKGLNGLNGTSNDLDGMPRIQQTTIDLGPLESPFAPLAVELTEFAAHRSGAAVLIDWSTLTEINHDRFEIERSQNGVHFSTIGTQLGLNIYNSRTVYQFLDNAPQAGANYYRLKSIDRSGQVEYSAVRQVVFSAGTFVVYPNPTRDFFNIQSDYQLTYDVSYHISNAQGQVIYRGVLESRNHDLFERFEVPEHWLSGLYFLHIDQSALSTAPIKFVLQKEY